MSNDVSSFYERFPYPLSDPESSASVNGSAYLKVIAFETRAGGFPGRRFLDVGCGTGHRLLDIAKAFPRAAFVGFDVSHRSIALAKEQAKREGVENVQFLEADLNSFQTTDRFDFILANGVLHHLDDPGEGLRKLAPFLDPAGIFVAWVFHPYGEHSRLMKRRLLRTLLSEDRDDFDKGVALMRDMGLAVSPQRYGKSYGERLGECDEVTKNADAFLNPRVVPLGFSKALALFQENGFAWAAIDQINYSETGAFLDLGERSEGPPWVLQIEGLFKSMLARDYYFALSKKERLSAIALAAEPTGFTIVGGGSFTTELLSPRCRTNAFDLARWPAGAEPEEANQAAEKGRR